MNREQSVERSMNQLLDAVENMLAVCSTICAAVDDLRRALDNFKIVCGDSRAQKPLTALSQRILDAVRPRFVFEPDKGTWKDVTQAEKEAWLASLSADNTEVVLANCPEVCAGVALPSPGKNAEPAKLLPGIGLLRLSREEYNRLTDAAVVQPREAGERLLASLGYPGGRILAVSTHVFFDMDDYLLKIEHASIPAVVSGHALPFIPLGGLGATKAESPSEFAGRDASLKQFKEMLQKAGSDKISVDIHCKPPQECIGRLNGLPLYKADKILALRPGESADVLVNKDGTFSLPVCECGGDAAKSTHSSWCPKAPKP